MEPRRAYDEIKALIEAVGIDITDELAGKILDQVRANSIALKRSASDNELIYIYQDFQAGDNHLMRD